MHPTSFYQLPSAFRCAIEKPETLLLLARLSIPLSNFANRTEWVNVFCHLPLQIFNRPVVGYPSDFVSSISFIIHNLTTFKYTQFKMYLPSKWCEQICKLHSNNRHVLWKLRFSMKIDDNIEKGANGVRDVAGTGRMWWMDGWLDGWWGRGEGRRGSDHNDEQQHHNYGH